MIRSLYTAASGMKANQLYVDNIANNLANVNTTGFKKSKLEFEDLVYQNIISPGGETSDGLKKPTSLQVGLGVRSVANKKLFIQGALANTGNPTDLAIQGEGFFQIRMPNGDIGYSRTGAFSVTSDGYLTNADGYLVEPSINIPTEANGIFTITKEGQVTVSVDDSGVDEEIGQMELAKFVNPGGLEALGGNLYRATDASGPALIGNPGENEMGMVRQQWLEGSNVQLVEEMVDMIKAQRAYEISSKSIQTADTMLQTANQLKR
ncbi:MAG: flagellar basal-body rod protein FlgG [Fibrobacterales bacterium]